MRAYNKPMILDRRQFLEGLPALLPAGLAASAEEGRKTRFYVFEQYFLEQGSQPGRIHDFFSKALLPAMERIHKGPKIFLEAVLAPHVPEVAAIIGLESCDQVWSVSKATDYSPEIVAPQKPPAAPRIFELRTYHSPTARQAKALHERFSNSEIKIFHRVGVNPILYSSTVFGANRPNLTYLIPFDTLAAREKAWNAFSADEEWTRVRQESINRSGQISSVIQISIYRAMGYSPIR